MAGVSKFKSLKDRILENCIQDKETGCIVWQGWGTNGYGMIRANGRRLFVHRLMYQIVVGPISDDLCACHKCDNRLCVNTEHIFVGSRADNNADKVNKNRQAKGAKHGNAVRLKRKHKFGEEVAAKVKAAYADIKNQYKVATMFGMSQANVHKIINNKLWSIK